MGNNWVDSINAVHENRVVQYADPVKLTFADGTPDIATCTRRLICTVPAYSVILRVLYRRAVAFNAGGNDYLTVGTASDDDLLVDDADISSAAATIPVWVMTTTLPYYVSAEINAKTRLLMEAMMIPVLPTVMRVASSFKVTSRR